MTAPLTPEELRRIRAELPLGEEWSNETMRRVLTELDRVTAERDCVVTALGFMPLQLREAVRAGDLDKCRAWAMRGEDFKRELQEARMSGQAEAKRLREALEEIRPDCEQCGASATRMFRTEGDGPYWLCDSTDAEHGEEFYCGEEVELPKLRAALAPHRRRHPRPAAGGDVSESENYEPPPIVADGPTLRRIATWQAHLTEARAVLKLVEWGTEGRCPCCRRPVPPPSLRGTGHAPDCRLDAVIGSKA